MNIIIIVESKTKAILLQKSLGHKFTVLECNGHIADLPVNKLGYDEETFVSHYIITKSGKTFLSKLEEIIKKSSIESIFLCTDPDREGEIIAFQIQHYVSMFFKGSISRIVLKEMSGHALKEAILHSVSVNLALVESQQARRILDRMIGYKISNLLYKKLYFPISAGRVQTPALSIICDKFFSYLNFIPKTYFKLVAISNKQVTDVSFKDISKFNDIRDVPNVEMKDFQYSTSTTYTSILKSPLPLNTVSLQRQAYSCFGFSAKRTMQAAQSLFEGKKGGKSEDREGLITYLRTDSKRMSVPFFDSVVALLKQQYEFADTVQPEIFKEEEKYIQDAHECIRPVNVDITPASVENYLTADEFKIYSLIYYVSICSCMIPAEIQNVKTCFANEVLESTFTLTSQSIVQKGFLTIEDIKTFISFSLDEYNKEDIKFEIRKSTERGPNIMTESSLISKLNDASIGRPSTYATICPLLKARNYIKDDGNNLVPTGLGRFVRKEMLFFVEFFDLDFTAYMEDKLNDICKGQVSKKDFLQECSNKIQSYIMAYSERLKQVPHHITLNQSCLVCGCNCTIKLGRFGPYYTCDNNHKYSLEEEILNLFFADPITELSLKALSVKKFYKTDILDEQDHHMFYDGKTLFCRLCRIKKTSEGIAFITHV